jgi:hypothetical protein
MALYLVQSSRQNSDSSNGINAIIVDATSAAEALTKAQAKAAATPLIGGEIAVNRDPGGWTVTALDAFVQAEPGDAVLVQGGKLCPPGTLRG